MKLLKAEVSNFSSYNHLEFDFQNLDLSLVYGATGSGKSTLLDIVPWILFGETAKGGNVDEVRSWNNQDEPTQGVLTVDEPLIGPIKVTRVRGKSSENDLYWEEAKGEQKLRGKDITETQKLLNKRLGLDLDTYFASSYYCEFSPVASFFTSKLKDQREVFEKIANLELPVKLLESTIKEKKTLKAEIETSQYDLSSKEGYLKSLKSTFIIVTKEALNWCTKQAGLILILQDNKNAFDQIKEQEIKDAQDKFDKWQNNQVLQIDQLLEKISKLKESIKPESYFNKEKACPTCGNVSIKVSQMQRDNDKLKMSLRITENDLNKVRESQNPHKYLLEKALKLTNEYDKLMKIESDKPNPFVSQLDTLKSDMPKLEKEIQDLTAEIQEANYKFTSLEQLYDISFELRAELLKRVVNEVQTQTNQYLEKYFDSELKAQFLLESTDKLEVRIQKNGHECVFRQLSKGQRQLLKLCFGIAIMKSSANRSGIHVDNLFFDESLDGMDSDLKIKAFNLFSELEKDHSSIMVIDHSSELQELFNSKFHVVITGDISNIKEI